jgi:16S rRNA (adenine1518-N6/adenine1519-N6)-dimethyltransferase
MENVTTVAFRQRRKMLRQSLKGFGDAKTLLETANIDPTERPERINVAGFVALAQAIIERNNKRGF